MRIIAIILSLALCFTIITAAETHARGARPTPRAVKIKRPPKVSTLVVGRAIRTRPVRAKRILPPLDD